MAKLINGNGNPAIYAAEDADLIASLAGNVTCISNVGNKYAATEEDATIIRLDDGVIITKEGRRIQLEAGESDTFYIPTGTSGQTNYYIIGYKLVQNADSTQVAEQFVQKMNSSSETITEDTFRSGATEVYVSVYRVTQVGFTIDSVDGLLPELTNISELKSDLSVEKISDSEVTVPTGSDDYSINPFAVKCGNIVTLGCTVSSGTLAVPFAGRTITFPSRLKTTSDGGWYAVAGWSSSNDVEPAVLRGTSLALPPSTALRNLAIYTITYVISPYTN